MSNPLAIAAVTHTLRNLIFRGVTADLAGTTVTTRPPDKARGNNSGNQVNLFLYQTVLDGAWRNQDLPPGVKAGESGQPPLPLDLFYLVTTYGEDDDDTFSHRLLGRAMSVLHDHPVLGTDEIRAALPNNDLHRQVERVRVTLQPLSLEELSKLWTTFQTQYRISAAYQASVVLIESGRPARAPLPVLTHGPGDRGPEAQADLVPPFPTLLSIGFPKEQPSALPGDELTLVGHHLAGTSLVVRFSHPLLAGPVEVPPPPIVAASATEIKVILPSGPTQVPAGFCTVAVQVSRPNEPDYPTNTLAFSVAPRVTNLPRTVARDNNGNAALSLTCAPRVLPDQRVDLLLGERQVAAEPRLAVTNTLNFIIPKAVPGVYLTRLRVDGVDSPLVDRSVKPPVFDQTQKVTIT